MNKHGKNVANIMTLIFISETHALVLNAAHLVDSVGPQVQEKEEDRGKLDWSNAIHLVP